MTTAAAPGQVIATEPVATGEARLYQNLAKRQIPGLDAIRAFAVFLVMTYHFGFTSIPGGYGVVAFFVLSGFLITWLLLKEQDATGTVSLRKFYIRRGLRIFPAFYAFWILLVAALIVTGRHVPWAHAVSAFVYLSNYYNAILGDPNTGFSHTWSLAIEEQFYLLWPAVFLLLIRQPQKMAGRLVGLILAVWIYRVVLVHGFGVDQSYLYASFDTRFDSLLVGCLAAVVLHRRRAERVTRWILAHPALALLPLLGVFVLVMDLPFGIPRRRDIFGFALVPPLLALFMVQVIGFQGTRSWSWLNHPVLRFLGRISYPLYLYQQITLHMVRDALADWPVALQFAAACAVTVFVASCSYYMIERPFLRFKSRFAGAG
jgi:peptidoglycan/LPS O-acetylase OafA/YrhL